MRAINKAVALQCRSEGICTSRETSGDLGGPSHRRRIVGGERDEGGRVGTKKPGRRGVGSGVRTVVRHPSSGAGAGRRGGGTDWWSNVGPELEGGQRNLGER